jgi:hypothetical protein
VDGRQGLATVKFSERARPVFDDVAAGILRAVSVGYLVHSWGDGGESEDGVPIRVAVKWQPIEISIVPVAADAGATVRGEPAMTSNRAEAAEQIRALCAYAKIDAVPLLEMGASVAEVRRAVIDHLAERSDATAPRQASIAFTGYDTLDDPHFRARAMGEAVFCRLNPSRAPSGPAREFAYASMADLAKASLRAAGFRGSFSPAEVVTRALNTTSDFPLALGNAVERELRAELASSLGGVRSLATVTSVRDFRARSYIGVGNDLGLEKTNEHGEFKYGTLAETGENVSVKTFGKIFGLTRQALVNDDLGALQRVGEVAAESARSLEANTCVDLLTANTGAGPTMSDGVALFHANHKNLAAATGAPSIGTIAAAVRGLRTQPGIGGRGIIGREPRAIVVPAALELIAKQIFAAFVPNTAASVNPFGGLEVVVDPRLDAKSETRWYVCSMGDDLLAAYLEGAAGPRVETKNGFEIDGVAFKISLDFGAAFIDHRGWHANNG